MPTPTKRRSPKAAPTLIAPAPIRQPNVDWARPELVHYLPAYEMIKDCLEGQSAVKRKGDIYLPRPNETDTSAANKARFDAYLTRAVFYAVTAHTAEVLTGQVFARETVLDLPPALEMLEDDADGTGVGFIQLAKKTLGWTLAFGRSGLMVDYPEAEGDATIADQQAGKVRPTIVAYRPEDIRNWQLRSIGGKLVLSLVVLRELHQEKVDEFEYRTVPQWRVLALDENNEYFVRVYRDADFKLISTVYPTDAAGNRWKELPFQPIGSENNDAEPDSPPLLAMSDLNIAHYRNSADYEETVYIVGQPTPYFAGLTKDWVDDVFQGEVQLGARAAIPLPAGATAGLLQVQANPAPLEAMKHKEQQMIALGARIVQEKTVQRTATEATDDQMATDSILSSTAKNVSAAFLWALETAGKFVSTAELDVDFKLTTEFDLMSLSPEQIKQYIMLCQDHFITVSEFRDMLMKAGIARLDYDEYVKERDKDAAFLLENNPDLQPDPNNPEPTAEE